MNLEDNIRSSARGQSKHYQGADDLLPRIEQRRRQRAARKMTASAVAAVVLVGGSAVALTSLRDRDNDPSVANSTEITVDETIAPATMPPTTPSPPTTAAVTPTTATAPTTSAAPDGSGPELNIPEATAPSDADVPSPTIRADGTTGIPEFWAVPQFGSEPVRGSGCGGAGGMGDTIPDGLWAGFIVDDGSDGTVGIDLLCVYMPEAAAGVLNNATATTITADPNYLIVNNSTRARFVPLSSGVVLRLAERGADGRCVDARATTQWGDIASDRQTWIRIHDGVITWILADCPPQ